MDHNTISNIAMDAALGLVGAYVLISIYNIKQTIFPKSLLFLESGLNYVERYVISLEQEFPEEFKPRENKLGGLVKTQ